MILKFIQLKKTKRNFQTNKLGKQIFSKFTY